MTTLADLHAVNLCGNSISDVMLLLLVHPNLTIVAVVFSIGRKFVACLQYRTTHDIIAVGASVHIRATQVGKPGTLSPRRQAHKPNAVL